MYKQAYGLEVSNSQEPYTEQMYKIEKGIKECPRCGDLTLSGYNDDTWACMSDSLVKTSILYSKSNHFSNSGMVTMCKVAFGDFDGT